MDVARCFARHRAAGRGTLRALAALAASALVVQCATLEGPAPPQLEELVPGFVYRTWFTDHTGFPANPDHFGAFTIQPMGTTLYLGFGADRPAYSDGALLGAFDDAGLRAIAPLDEQGMLDMAVANGALLIPGVDPCCPDWWESGNFYVYRPNSGLKKWRNLPNVFHSWGIWYDDAERALYLAASAHPGDFMTSDGQIWRTADEGAHWELVADKDDGVGAYRTYDVARHQARLFAISADGSCILVKQGLAQTTWEDAVPGRQVACIHRLVNFAGKLMALDVARSTLHVVPAKGGASEIDIPFTVDSVAFNWAAVAGGFLYVISDDGRVMVTRDLVAWDTVIPSAQRFMTIQYWPYRNWLVLAAKGGGGALWKLQLCNGAPC